MRQRLNTSFIILWITLWLAFVFPALAQEATPEATAEATPEAEVIVAPEPDVAAGENIFDGLLRFVDGLLDSLGENQNILMMVVLIIAVVFAGRNVSPDTIERFRGDATRTETKVDDVLVEILTLLRGMQTAPTSGTTGAGGNVFDDISDKNINNPPLILPDAPVGFEDNFALRGDVLTFADRLVEVPRGYLYHFETADANGKQYPHANINTNTTYGTRFNIASVAGVWGFLRLARLALARGVTYVLYLDYVADVRSAEQPLGKWLWWECLVNDRVLQPLLAVENGVNRAEWEVVSAGEARIEFRLRALYGSADDNSVVDVKRFGLAPGVGEKPA